MRILGRLCLLAIFLAAGGAGALRWSMANSEHTVSNPVPELNALNAAAILDDLESEDVKTRRAAFARHRQEYERLVARLIAIVGEEKQTYQWSDSRQLAAEQLGRIGTPAAFPVLIDNVAYEQHMVITEMTPFNGYPCAMALGKIGAPCVPSLIQFLRSPRTPVYSGVNVRQWNRRKHPITDKEHELYALLLMGIYGKEGGLRHAEEALQESPSAAKAGLNGVVQKIRQIKRQRQEKLQQLRQQSKDRLQ